MRRRGGIAGIVCVLVIGVAGCGGNDDPSEENSLELSLAEQNDSGETGTATLTELEDGRTRIVIDVSNPPSTPQPSHVHPGPCDDLGPPIAGLTNVVGGKSETVVPMSLAELQAGELVVHAHKSQQDYETSVFCAEIPATDGGGGY